jgi:putative membrane protein
VIRSYSDHAANERTFLAWVRTGIAVIAFGFVVERFNLFLRSLAVVAAGDATPRLPLRLLGPLGRGEGVVLIVGGTLLIAMATVRFVRTTRLIDDPGIHAASSVRAELILSAALLVVLAGFSIYLLLG